MVTGKPSLTATLLIGSFLMGGSSASAAAAASTAAAPRRFEPVRAYILAAMEKAHLPSVALAVSQHGRIVWEEAFGFADVEKRTPTSVHTLYGLASVTKILTATSAMVLAEEHKIDLDRPINAYLGAARLTSPRWDLANVTVRRVATHTGGLTTYDSICYADEPDCDRSLEDAITHYGIVFWQPGERFDYSNLGYGVLQEMIARVSGVPFPAFLELRVFAPLGMRECGMDGGAGVAQHYDADRRPVPPHREVAEGASSVACSADSLVRFGMFALRDHLRSQKPILRDAAIDRMRTETVAADNGQRYGLGWWITEDQHGVENIFDSGGTSDTSALLDTIPSQDVALAILMNTGSPVVSDIADQILAAMIPAYAADLERHTAPTTGDPSTAGVGEFAGTWVGTITTYRGTVPVMFEVGEDGSSQASVGQGPLAPARKARRYRNGIILGALGDVGTPDADRRTPYRIGFEMYPEEKGLYGAATTWQQPGARDGGLFSYWVRLERRNPSNSR